MEKDIIKGQNPLPCDLAEDKLDSNIHLVQMKHTEGIHSCTCGY